MKPILLGVMIVVASYVLNAQGWNSIVTTTISASGYTKGDDFSNKDGIHVLLTGSSSVKYVLLNSSGSVVRQTTFETDGGDFPSVSGNNSGVYAVYQKGSAIKVKNSTDAGASWNVIDNITFSDSYCSGVDAVADDRGLHVAYATRPSGNDPWETYYKRLESTTWTGYKNVTDYNSNEVGGFPTVTTSANRVHVSYNTTDHSSDPDYHPGYAKTRDYDFPSQQWLAPQLVFGDGSDMSISERVICDGTYLHMFYVTIIEDMGYVTYIHHKKRTVDGTSWSSSDLDQRYWRPTTTSTVDSKLHLLYQYSGISYRKYDGSNWSSEETATSSDEGTQGFHNMSSVSNDLYLIFKTTATSYLQYRQYDAAPAQPQNLAGSVVFSNGDHHPGLTWTGASEPDVVSGGYVLIHRRTKLHSQNWSAWSQIDQIAGSSTQYVDLSLYCEGNGADTAQYKTQTEDVQSHLSAFSSVVSVAYDHGIEKPGSSDHFALGPSDFRLSENYPNPFNPSTTISYELPRASNVNLVVLDVLGRELATLVQGYQEAGGKSVVWNASSVASGVYYLRMVASDELGKITYSKVNKLLLMK